MALSQTKIFKIKKNKRTLHKKELAKEMKVSIATINEYILGDRDMPQNINIVPEKNGMVLIEKEEKYETPKYDGVYYNELLNGDRTYYIIYTDIKTGKKPTLKIGKASAGITEKYCENIRNEILADMRLGKQQTKVMNKRVYKKILTLDMIAEKYHIGRILYLSKPNLKKSESLYRRRISPYIGNKDMSKITDKDITNIMLDLKPCLANRSINIVVEKISTIFNFAIKNNLFTGNNPAKSIKKLSANNDRTRYLATDEIQLLLDSVKHNNLLYLFTYIALTTGGRLTALCGIKVQDIDFTHNIINLSDEKGQSYYKTFLKQDKEFIALLKKQIEGMSSTDFIFRDTTLIGIKRYVQRELSKILDELFNLKLIEQEKLDDKNFNAEIRRNKVVIHTLRHTFASQLAIAGTPIYTIQKLMNHSDIKMTERYAKLSQDSGRNYIDIIF